MGGDIKNLLNYFKDDIIKKVNSNKYMNYYE